MQVTMGASRAWQTGSILAAFAIGVLAVATTCPMMGSQSVCPRRARLDCCARAHCDPRLLVGGRCRMTAAQAERLAVLSPSELPQGGMAFGAAESHGPPSLATVATAPDTAWVAYQRPSYLRFAVLRL